MKIINTFLLFVIMTFACQATLAVECSLRDMQAEIIDCNEEVFTVKIKFLHEEADSSFFELRGNGISYGSFQYKDLPITIEAIAVDPELKYEFVAIDSLLKDCVTDIGLGRVSCNNCSLGALSVVQDSCYDGLRSVTLDMEHADALTNADTLELLVNWEFVQTFTIDDLPLTFDSLDGYKTYFHVKVIDPNKSDCYVKREFEAISCEPMLGLLDVTPLQCNADSTYSAMVDFGYANIDSVGIYVNDSLYGIYATSELPITIDSVVTGESSTDHYTVCAIHEESCCIDRKVISPCSPAYCHMFRPIVEYLECDSGGYFVEIDFDVEGVFTDSFGIDADWEELGRFSYADLPVRAGPFTSDEWTDHYLLFYDLANHDCCTEYLMEGQLCPAECVITGAKLSDCRDDGSFQATISYEGFGFLHVDFFQDGQFLETYCIDENPIVIDSMYANGSNVTLKLCPSGVAAECAKITVEVPDGCETEECGFGAIDYEIVDCESDQFYLELHVLPPSIHKDYFVIEGPKDFREELFYQDSAHRLGPFPSGKYYEFHIADLKSGECFVKLPVGRVICDDECDLIVGSISVTCIESGLVLVDIDSVGADHGAFDIWVDDQPLGFVKAVDFPLLAEVETENDKLSVKVCISDNNTCCHEVIVGVEGCLTDTCLLEEMTLDTIGCEDDGFFVELELFGSWPEEGAFLLKIVDSLIGQFTYKDLPLKLGPIQSTSEDLLFTAISTTDSTCTISNELPPISCFTTPPASPGEQIVVLRCQGLDRFIKVPAILHEPTAVYLYNTNGLLLEQRDLSSDSRYVSLNITRPPSGLYVLRLQSSEGRVSRKVIIP